jgi:hypothetical protein
MLRYFITCVFIILVTLGRSASLLIPMDAAQQNHLKAYGIAYFTLQQGMSVDWLLNYRGGSFLIAYSPSVMNECSIRGVSQEFLTDEQTQALLEQIASPSINMNVVKMETAPEIAVYSPKNELILDETDAVIAVLDYAEIPYTLIYDEEVLMDELDKFDWLHLHHEDFTGQIHRFRWRESAVLEAKMQENTAMRFGYVSVAAMKFDVTKKIRGFCATGGYLFAMCSGAETFDIALAANGMDISDSYSDDGDVDLNIQEKLDFNKSFAFENFALESGRRFSNINTGRLSYYEPIDDYFTLFEFSAKWDIVPALLTQNHEAVIKEFFGQTTAFEKELVKPEALILGENAEGGRVRYIYGEFGKGHWTYYSGHDPERAPGRGGDRYPNLELHPHSPGYRLILNNVLFPSAKKKKQKT